MSNLEKNIKHYMKIKRIEHYSNLLFDIAHELGKKGEAAYDFVKREKSNFSKMLKGERGLKYEFIIPLEKIFGVSLARLLDEEAYKLPCEKINVPFDKGFRYYAYLDDPKLYKEEFDLLLTKEGNSIITKTDEFGKTFLDYIVEYNAVNGVRYIHDEYEIKINLSNNQFVFNKHKGNTWVNFDNSIEFARIVANMHDAELFNDIYDSYYLFYSSDNYAAPNSIFNDNDYLEILLDNDDLFKSLFEEKEYTFMLSEREKKKRNILSVTYNSINPIINSCLRYSLQHLDKYRNRARKILDFGISYNAKILSKINREEWYIRNEQGRLQSLKNSDDFQLVVFTNIEIDDVEIDNLLKQLPQFKKCYGL